MSSRPEIVAWFSSPPFVELGAYDRLASLWGQPVTFVVAEELRSERRELGWQGWSARAATYRSPTPGLEPRDFVNRVIKDHPNALHVFNGLLGGVSPYLRAFIDIAPDTQVVIVSERPGIYGVWWKRLFKRAALGIRHRLLRRRYGKHVSLLMALGDSGVEQFARYGWERSKLVPFMYCPPTVGHENIVPNSVQVSDPLRFVYVGRCSRYTKGTDTLIDAASGLPPGSWTLDLVGAYGDLADAVARWAHERAWVTHRGNWTPIQIAEHLPNYDVCVVPSRFDGWNVVVNEALHAGLGVIASDQAVSHELVAQSGAGRVVPASDPTALRAAMLEAITLSPEDWKNRAVRYRTNISPDAVGGYFAAVLNALLEQSPAWPSRPWIYNRSSCD